ncbi:hypothetical protein [Leptolyngbya iicbica]|uniref:Uncharacterized protein n=2 Tax=Cyanophyceae TaxID=3028117 RepID=A0A4Q7EAT5_9CYAN|nr:hypothetical protein [Leptolyngbya sp. LK]RZM79619.1 hypothetical protein DYY88_12985 [Leptolyngbya sp. LK]
MAISRIGALVGLSAGLLGAIAPAWGQSPGLYYAWRSVEMNLTTCLDRSTAALTNAGLTDIQVEGNSVAGTTDISTAVFVCLENSEPMTVMIMVSSTDDDAAFDLRETLKASF